MSEARRLLAALVDMLERSNTAHLNYSIIDGKTVYVDDLIKSANVCLEKSFIDMNFCPECGNSEFMIGINLPDNEERICTECGQSWFADIDYTDVIRAHLKDRISLKQELENPLPEPTDQCGTCNAIGVVTRRVPVSWATIKAIYAKASEHFAASSGF